MSTFIEEYDLAFIAFYEPSGKIWGWFTTKDHRNLLINGDSAKRVRRPRETYAFWAVVGKTITIKKHRPWQNNLDWLKRKKLDGKYVETTADHLYEIWPGFNDDMDQRLLFLRLTGELEI